MESFKNKFLAGMYNSGQVLPERVFVTIEWDRTRGRLSLSGESRNMGGQIHDILTDEDFTPAFDVDAELLAKLWKTWHLNDMRAGCVHQREWDTTEEVEIVTYKLTNEALREKGRLQQETWKRLQRGETVTLTQGERDLVALDYFHKGTPDSEGPEAGRYEVDKREIKAVGWVRPDEHPRGLLTKPCEECGYKYGSQWLREDVPEDVLRTLKDFGGN